VLNITLECDSPLLKSHCAAYIPFAYVVQIVSADPHPLQPWFYAIFLFTTTRNGVAAKELERQLGVTYKTAWRMADLIRKHMATVDGEAQVGGEGKVVEINETWIGGSLRFRPHRGQSRSQRQNKTLVMGMLERAATW
jgi:transposase